MTALFYTLGVVIFVVAILASIGLHELGHMIPAKKFGGKVTQYFIGFGPTVWSRQRGETEYGVKAIPLGGYVKIVGMLPPGADELDEDVLDVARDGEDVVEDVDLFVRAFGAGAGAEVARALAFALGATSALGSAFGLGAGFGVGFGFGLATAVIPTGPAETLTLSATAGAVTEVAPATAVRPELRDVVRAAASVRSRATRAEVWPESSTWGGSACTGMATAAAMLVARPRPTRLLTTVGRDIDDNERRSGSRPRS